ncbi:Tripartite tricarboxylate transporter TctB family protein [Brevibacterium iodinum ATCC 49514]|uniref:Tripartite tricarboxylate transporter TctB family protein n=1 Tax=Brevibacterium iodinum ATCC 49514 TaxID=1255616 RepID=A0A2H1J6J7_9MICO|nr:tripartite tricarboxylate transporter TctB family protein [Brevibacterium iodinum]SMX83100.1 Tripartite tricarboxylate transporter TctB family protein [Brevibacterium iodinum ATCC 49514]SUW14255.1 Tripartite tricarboxylate transporter TctB family [Brevibacterium iodinum]
MTAHRTDLITGGAIAVIGAVYYIATFAIQETANIVTPRTFPAIVGIGLIVLGLFVAGQAIVRHRKDTLAEAAPGSAGSAESAGAGSGSAGSSGSTDVTAASDGDGAAASAKDSEPAGGASGIVLEAPPEPPGRKVVFQFALFFVYLAILIPVGFLLSTVAFLMGLTSIYVPEKWIRNLIFSVLFSVVVYAAFVYGLAVYLPVGILG